MADIINLNKLRKQRARAAEAAEAAANRIKFGRTQAQKQLETAQAEIAQHRLQLLRRERPPTDGDDTPR